MYIFQVVDVDDDHSNLKPTSVRPDEPQHNGIHLNDLIERWNKPIKRTTKVTIFLITKRILIRGQENANLHTSLDTFEILTIKFDFWWSKDKSLINEEENKILCSFSKLQKRQLESLRFKFFFQINFSSFNWFLSLNVASYVSIASMCSTFLRQLDKLEYFQRQDHRKFKCLFWNESNNAGLEILYFNQEHKK